MINGRKRNTIIDILKGITIILVILAHCIQFGSGLYYLESQSFFDNLLFKLIYSFHMPLFMLISGYLFCFTVKKYSFNYILKTRFTNLIIPIIVWQTIWNFIEDLKNQNNPSFLFVFDSYINTLWFITSVFFNSLVVVFCNKYAKDSLLLYGLIIIISLFIPNYYGYNLYVYMLPYFLCGYFYNKVGGITNKLNRIIIISRYIFLIILFLFLLYHFDTKDYAYTSGTFIIRNHDISTSQICTDIFRWAIGFIGSLCVILSVKFIYTRHDQSILLVYMSIIGTKTMGLYIISTYLFKLFYLLHIKEANYIYIVIECIIVTLISYLLTWLIEQNSFLKKYLLGGR